MIGKFEYMAGKTLAYNDFGPKEGAAVLVQHGTTASIRDTDLFDELSVRRRVICIARPGYGESSPHILENFLEYGKLIEKLAAELGLEKFDVLGSSAGAPYAYAIAKACPAQTGNVYIYSGTPALYDTEIQKNWPFPVSKDLSIEEAQKIAYEVFYSHYSEEDRKKSDVKDSMANNCFGEGQNLRIRFKDWGFTLPELKAKVYMRHSKKDEALPYALTQRTADLLRGCELELLEEGGHFSVEGFKSFLRRII